MTSRTTTRTRTGLLATAAAAVLAVTATGPATAAPASASATPASASTAGPAAHVRFFAHLDVNGGQRPENITLEPGGSAVVTFAYNRQVARITPDGRVHVLATLPAPPAGSVTPALTSPFLGGIVRSHDGTLYFLYATGSSDLTGLWRLRPGGTPQRIAALPATGLPNGLALDEHAGVLYAADSVLGTVWRVPVTGGAPTAWSTAPELAADGFLGANGLKVHHGAVWVSNLDRGTVLRIPVTRHGTAGDVQIRATGLVDIDDFAFTGRGDTLLAAINKDNEVARVEPGGRHTAVLTAADGLQGPTSLAVRGTTAYVASAAYFTNDDPNLLAARIVPGE
ncbi:SMP-30/gluconolactonase/LRE family protein [Streptomyces cinerochromogenes]|uniref:SMP-30/gluconolactonase/LRE family protein n=1 Tax=Streptomyces cinerochromogenes TaxID=66422 RepID=UPI0036C7D47D